MKAMSERELKDLLTPRQRPEPPADLLERLQREIPEQLPAVPELVEGGRVVRFPISRQRAWLLAATIAAAVGGGYFVVRNQELARPEGVDHALTEQEVASSAASPEEMRGRSEAGGSDAVPPEARESVLQKLEAKEPGRLLGVRGGAADAPPAPDDEALGELPGGQAVEQELRPRAEPETQLRLTEAQASTLREPQETERLLSLRPQAEQERLSEPTTEAARLAGDPSAGQLRGAARDETGAVLPGVLVTVTSPDDSVHRTTVTDGRGEYAVPGLEPGEYRVEFELEGFSSTSNLADVAAGEGTPSDAEMEVEEIAEEITVTAEAPVITSSSSSASIVGGDRRSGKRRQRRERKQALRPAQSPPPLQAFAEPPPPPAPRPSTGGTAEPNDAPYGDVFFESADTNPFIDPEDDRLSTFGLDVDTGSYTVVRRYLTDSHLPPADAVRVEELVNYFDYGDAPPENEDFRIHAAGAPSIFAEGERYYLLRFNLRGREVAAENRPPAVLTFVVDVSGSMAQENRLGLVKRALGLLLDELRPDDRVGLVVYGSRGRVVLEPTGDRNAIRRAIERLVPEGSTNAEEGLALAYELAARHHRSGAIHRVLLCSDGVANVGSTSADAILRRIRREAEAGIELTTVGFGMGNYNDALMERLADAGNGRYAYVDVLDEAHRIFVENLTGTLQTIAAEARVQVEFDPEVVSRYRLLGYENRDIADERFRDDRVDAGEVGAGHAVTALYELKLKEKIRRRDQIATLHLRYGSVAKGEIVELERAVTGADFAGRWEGASAAFRLTSLVAEFAEVLKQSYWAREGDLNEVFRRAQKVSAELEGNREVADFVSLVGRAAKLRERAEKAKGR